MTAADTTPLPPPPRLPFALAWGLFWVLMVTVALHDYARAGGGEFWKPLLWEGSSFAVASVMALSLWRRVGALDALLGRPWRWFAPTLWRLALMAPAFVVAVYTLRHGVYALLGLRYTHAPWPQVFAYETVKFSMFYLLFAAVLFGLRSHAAMNAERLRAERQERLAQQAQLLQLTQQIEPHFIFNALNTIAATVHEDAELADRLLTRLAALLRAATDLARSPVRALADELELLAAYAEIMQQRFGSRLTLHFQIDDAARACRVPSLLLQPLLENAFRHGVERHPGPAAITVSARREGARLHLSVEDDVGRLDAAAVDGVGLTNVRQRLHSLHGAAATLALQARLPRGVAALIELPCGC